MVHTRTLYLLLYQKSERLSRLGHGGRGPQCWSGSKPSSTAYALSERNCRRLVGEDGHIRRARPAV
eukprot:scaffold18789_cov64-Phaeocystis_antarctica.AAC.4